MADRPQVNGWNNINLNKPEEYSSEFVIDGNRYANVTNVTTGQRQLYFVQPVSNARGTPITTTNADGTITKGGNYDNFVRFNGVEKLNNAEKANKQASIALLSNKDISTPAEATEIKNSKEFKSTTVGQNSASGSETTIVDGLAGTDAVKEKEGTRNIFPKNLVYPTNLAQTRQDVIKFNMIKYRPKTFSQTTFGFSDRLSAVEKDFIGTVVLPIPNGISDTNAVTWGGADMNAADAAAVNIATSGIEGGGSGLTSAAENVSKTLIGASDEVKKAIVGAFVGEATGIQGILARTAGLVINPNLELLFSAPTLRPFNFTFKLASRSPTESQMIRSIIRFFKQGMSPQRSQSTLFLKAPHTFQIQYLHRGEEHKFLNKFKECALQSFNVNYTPEGQYATFNDGAMVSYQITMQFQELEPIFNDDYTNDGTNPSPDIGF
jgi:hypothetical protein